MAAMQRRLKTFDEKWHINFLRPRDMAQAGFFYLGIDDQVKCKECEREFLDWEQGDDPLQQHILHSPDCPFIIDILSTVDGRFRTFNNWPVIFLRPREMADAGFYYTGKRDSVKCFKCEKRFDLWEDGDVPLVEHYFHSPKCSIVRGLGEIIYESGLYGSCTAEVLYSCVRVRSIEYWLNSEGFIQRLKPFGKNTMITFNARLETFDNCPKTVKQDIYTLCKAGFFYSGNGRTDYMTCYYCTVSLNDWTCDDEPWTRHAKWSKTCGHLLLNKTKSFVDKVHNVENYIINFNRQELFNLIAKRKNTYIFDTKMKIRMTKKYFNGLQITNTLSVKNLHHLSEIIDPNSVPDSLLCKICYKEEIKVIFVPCGHAIACIECALTLRDCALCRYPFYKLMRVYLCINEVNDENLQLAPSSSKMCSSNTSNPILCKVCFKEEMATIFLPCRHVYACGKCAEEINECSICKENVYSLIQLYL